MNADSGSLNINLSRVDNLEKLLFIGKTDNLISHK